MKLTVIPLMGPFHLRYPSYNSVVVKDIVKATQPDVVITTVLSNEDFKNPLWQDTLELALPQSVIPWVKKQKLPLIGVFEPSPDPKASQDFKRYANEYPKLGEALREVERHLRPVVQLLEESLNQERIQNEVLALLHVYQTHRESVFVDGPGTNWLHQRVKSMAQKIAVLPYENVTVLASAEHIPFLQEELGSQFSELPKVEITEESRERSLLDFAFRTDVSEPGNVLAKLRELKNTEARYHEANLLLANGHSLEALEVLEQSSHTDFFEPYYLPGYLLARLGQLYDLNGQREAALRAYKGVRALSYAPQEALEEAQQGLEQPFILPRAKSR
jgi:tetratricopeptide (TPR) repeat protein